MMNATTDCFVTLRPWTKADLTSLVENANNVNVWNGMRDSFPNPYTEKDGRFFLRMVAKRTILPLEFAIVVEGKAVGGIGLKMQRARPPLIAEIGYWLGEPYWSKGIMTKAVNLVTGYAFQYLKLREIEAYVLEYNKASMQVLMKAGFKYDGLHYETVRKKGQIVYFHIFSILSKE
ncbi:MAG: GNAT family N-acetyltransferase [Tannerellaceae bacterium]|jgi:RimJ/RimL family protein N-acetyltransferase|nr:GNAT family N-acetyltransferase [Tannerellaceae bacterium]